MVSLDFDVADVEWFGEVCFFGYYFHVRSQVINWGLFCLKASMPKDGNKGADV